MFIPAYSYGILVVFTIRRILLKYSGSLSSLMAYSVKRVSISISWETLEEIASGRNFVSSEMENRKTSLFRARGDAALLVTDMIGTPCSFRISTIRRTSLFLPVCDTIRAQSFSLSLPASVSYTHLTAARCCGN